MSTAIFGLDFNPEPIECVVPSCKADSCFIVKYQPHPHFEDRWYPLCIKHVVTSDQTPCRGCGGKLFQRIAIESL